MSAPNTNDLDALRRAQRAHEPSMEEILASIRAIIADDREPARQEPATKPEPKAEAPSEPRIVFSNDAVRPVKSEPPKAETVPTQRVAPEPARAAPEPSTPTVVWSRPRVEPVVRLETKIEPRIEAKVEAKVEPQPEPRVESPPEPAPVLRARIEPEPAPEPIVEIVEPLISEETDRVVASQFEALTETVARQSSELVDSLTREMLRPMIKTWLDENLPSMVERLIRAEIQRVARGGR